MGSRGLELVSHYPEVLSRDDINAIVLKSMPLSAKNGDFTTTNAGLNHISSYIFSIPGEVRDNIASLVAVFSTTDYNPKVIKKVFSFTVVELRKKELINEDILSNILPKLFKGFLEGNVRIQISSIVKLEIDFKSFNEIDIDKKSRQDVKNDLW